MLVGLSLVSLAGVAVSFTAGGVLVGVTAALAFAVILVLTKVIVELTAELRRIRRVVATTGTLTHKIDRRVEAVREDLVRAQATNDADTAKQLEWNRATASRLDESTKRLVVSEKATALQERFNEAVLNRVRGVEASTGRQTSTNDRLVERIRSLEVSRTELARFADSTGPRVAALEVKAVAVLDELEELRLSRNHRTGEHLELKLASAAKRLRSQIQD